MGPQLQLHLLLVAAAALALADTDESPWNTSEATLSDVSVDLPSADNVTASVTPPPMDAAGVWNVLSLETENKQAQMSSANVSKDLGTKTHMNKVGHGEERNHRTRQRRRRKRLRLSKTYSSGNTSVSVLSVENLNLTLDANKNRKLNTNNKITIDKKRKKKNREERRKKKLKLKLQERDRRKQRRKNERLRRKYRKERKKKLARKGAIAAQPNDKALSVVNITDTSLTLSNKTVMPAVDASRNTSQTDILKPFTENADLSFNISTSTERNTEVNNQDFLRDDNSLIIQSKEEKHYDHNEDNILLPFAAGTLLQQDQLSDVPMSSDDNEHKKFDSTLTKNYETHGQPHFSFIGYTKKQFEEQHHEPEVDENDTTLNSKSIMNKIFVTDSMELTHESYPSYETAISHNEEPFGDLSCLNGTLLPAPNVPHSWVKYVRLSTSSVKELLFAEYRCKFGYRLAQHSKSKLLCINRRWVGNVPKCMPYKLHEGNRSLCDYNKGDCDQMCMETAGKLTCLCFKGFTLNGTICKDIDECATSNGGCEYKCQNSAGAYRCLCPPGLRLGDDQKSCIDVNECLLRNGHGPCQDLCHNEWGSYKCSCEALPGTRLSSDNHTCEDEDECASGAAGCSHGCLNTLGNAFCLCPMGFMLGADWKTCQDIDECEEEYLEAEPCDLGCVNTIGSYYCRTECSPGWEITTIRGKRTCEDTDECTLGTSGCSHFCHNIPGGFVCSCRSGYMLAPDNTTCIDGAMRDVCPPLEIPTHGYVECARSPSVQPEQRHTRVVNHAGAVCELRCPHGYRQRGEYRRVCGRDRIWQGPNSGHCIPWPVPVIQCPKNITYYLDPGRSTAYVEFPKPRTSVDWSRNIESFPNWGKDLEADLPAGYWEVKFIARHPVSHHASACSFSINVVKRTFQLPVP